MKCIIFANGEYGNLKQYKELLGQSDLILCADGGANYAYALSVVPHCILGDLDSIDHRVLSHYTKLGVEIKKFSSRKDFTDTQLVLMEAEMRGASEITLIGTLGRRLDHTLANIYSGMDLSMKGIKVVHYCPEYIAYLVHDYLELAGKKGDLVSVLALSDEARGVNETGFEYPLAEAVLHKSNPYSICNVMTGNRGTISLKQGVLLVIHYQS